VLALVLVAAAVAPGEASRAPAARCSRSACARQVAAIRWTRPLPGAWAAQSDALGTVLSQGEAYAAAGSGVAAVGYGLTVVAYQLTTGKARWATTLTGFPLGAAIVSVRAWPGVVTAGVSIPAEGAASARREEVVLSTVSGQRAGTYPAAPYGGAVWATRDRTVIVGSQAVTSYTASGRVAWRRATGAVAQAWRVAGDSLLVTVDRAGFLGSAPVTALRRISLTTGAEKVLRPAGGSYAGTLSGAVGGTVLFSGSAGLTAYSAADGRELWQRPHAVLQAVDAQRQTLYVANGNALIGLDPRTQKVVTRSASPGAAGLYTVSAGIALGLDEGAEGDAWGYDLARKQVIWTTRAIPWPHFFVDLSGLGGSSDKTGGTVILASCAHVGVAAGNGAPPCTRPELVAIGPDRAARQAR
jgi:hypothetical protein